jgi:hypothetical protein
MKSYYKKDENYMDDNIIVVHCKLTRFTIIRKELRMPSLKRKALQLLLKRILK